MYIHFLSFTYFKVTLVFAFICLFVNVKLSMRRSPAAMTQEVVEVGLVQGRGRQREGSQEPAEVEPLNHPFSFLSGGFPRYFSNNYLHVFDLFTWSVASACLDCSKNLMWSVMRESMVVAIEETLTNWPSLEDAPDIVVGKPQQWSQDGRHTTGHWLEAGHSSMGTPPATFSLATRWITKPGNMRRAAWGPQ